MRRIPFRFADKDHDHCGEINKSKDDGGYLDKFVDEVKILCVLGSSLHLSLANLSSFFAGCVVFWSTSCI